jgi:hypothetical protein
MGFMTAQAHSDLPRIDAGTGIGTGGKGNGGMTTVVSRAQTDLAFA